MQRVVRGGNLRESRTAGCGKILRQRQGGDRPQQGDCGSGLELSGGLVTQMAVRTARLVVGILVVPVADHTRGEDQQRDERQRNAENAKGVSHTKISDSNQGSGNPLMITGCKTRVKRCTFRVRRMEPGRVGHVLA
jgi:hypothetical protein